MILFFELFVVAGALFAGLHAWARRGAAGAWLFGSLLLLGWVRETYVVLRDLLYGFPVLDLVFAGTPVIAAVIWAFSIYVALSWSEEVGAPRWRDDLPAASTLLLVAAFMIALACFYEPFLAHTGMARWQSGTRRTAGVPWIALIGYPTMAALHLLAYGATARWLPRAWPRGVALALLVPALAIAHAWGLQRLKHALGW
jgi:hypothetical protein